MIAAASSSPSYHFCSFKRQRPQEQTSPPRSETFLRASGVTPGSFPCLQSLREGPPTLCRNSWCGRRWRRGPGSCRSAAAATARGDSYSRRRWAGPCSQNRDSPTIRHIHGKEIEVMVFHWTIWSFLQPHFFLYRLTPAGSSWHTSSDEIILSPACCLLSVNPSRTSEKL